MSAARWSADRLLLGLWFALVIVFVLFPLLLLGPLALNHSEFLRFPPERISMRWFAVLFTEPSWRDAMVLSVKVAAMTTVISLLLGTGVALVLVRLGGLAGRALYGLMVAPLIVPGIVLALGLFMLLARARLLESLWMLALAHAVVATPFVVLLVAGALRGIDPVIGRAARVLGAGPVAAFIHITMPPLMPALVASAMFAFFASFDELVITLFIAGAMETLPVRIWNDLNLRLDPTVAAASVVMILLSVLGFGLAEIIRRRTPRSS